MKVTYAVRDYTGAERKKTREVHEGAVRRKEDERSSGEAYLTSSRNFSSSIVSGILGLEQTNNV